MNTALETRNIRVGRFFFIRLGIVLHFHVRIDSFIKAKRREMHLASLVAREKKSLSKMNI